MTTGAPLSGRRCAGAGKGGCFQAYPKAHSRLKITTSQIAFSGIGVCHKFSGVHLPMAWNGNSIEWIDVWINKGDPRLVV